MNRLLVMYFIWKGVMIMSQSQYWVKPGDTLLKIAESHNRSVDHIKQMNQLNSNIIYVGQMLRIPSSAATYTVQQGDTLLSISERFQTPVDEVKEINQLHSNLIYVGQQLDIPTTRQRHMRMDYTVKAGDSLYQIATNNNTTAKSIMVLNDLSSDALTIGQTLKIPVYTEVIVKSDRANVRTGPGKGYNVITQMKTGAKLALLGHSRKLVQSPIV